MSSFRILFVALALCAAACSPPPASARRPNVLILSIDTLRADHLGCYGYDMPTSPHIDAFAREAVVFEHAESASSWTLPSMTSLMTSLPASAHGCTGLGSRLDPSYTTLAEILRDAGYDTAIVASHLFLGTTYGLQQGFTHVDTSIVQEEADITSQDLSEVGADWLQAKAAVKLARAQGHAPDGDDGGPWMLWLHFFDPHAPYLPHPGVSERFGLEDPRDLYDGEIAFTDKYVGRVLDTLRRWGLDEDTIVVIVADHGEEFGEHGNSGHGYALYEECVHIPLIVKVPGISARRVSTTVPSIDLLPTLLELCHVRVPNEIQGQTLGPLLEGEHGADREALSEVSWQAKQDLRCVREGRWKLIDHKLDSESALLVFDEQNDPTEECDLFPGEAARAGDMRERIAIRVREALRIASAYTTLGVAGLSPSERQRLRGFGYTGDEDAKPGDAKTKPPVQVPKVPGPAQPQPSPVEPKKEPK